MASNVTTFKDSVDAIAQYNVALKALKAKDQEPFLKLSKKDGKDVLTTTTTVAERTLFADIAKSFASQEAGSIGAQMKTATGEEIATLATNVELLDKVLTQYRDVLDTGVIGGMYQEERHTQVKKDLKDLPAIQQAVSKQAIATLAAQAAVKPAEAKPAEVSVLVTTYAGSNAKVKAMMEAIKNPKNEKGEPLTGSAKKKAIKEAQKAQHKAIMNLLGEQMKLAKKIEDKTARRAAKKETAKLQKKELMNEGKRLKVKVDALGTQEKLSEKDEKNLEKRAKRLTKVATKLEQLGELKIGSKQFKVAEKDLKKIAPKEKSGESSDVEKKEESKASDSEKAAKKKKHKKKKESTSSSSSSSASSSSK